MKKMTSSTVATLRDAINEALKSLGEQHGVTIHCGNAKYDEFSVTFSLVADIAATEDFDPEREKWAKHVAFTGLTPEDYGKPIYIGDTQYIICGFNSSAKKNCIKLKAPNGQEYIADTATVLAALGRNRLGTSDDKLAEATCNANAVILGLSVRYGQEITWLGKHFKVLEVNLKAPKYPIIAADVNTGKRYKLPVDAGKPAAN